MGCFMGCFGLSSNKKRRSSIRKILPRDQRNCNYEQLQSSDPTDFCNFVDNPEKISNSNLRVGEEDKKGTTITKKRVRFNLNVQTYEPVLPTRYEYDCRDTRDTEEGKGDKKSEDLRSRSVYPSNYRYHNCVDSFEDEDDEMGCGESDLEDEDYYTDDENDYEDDADDEDEEEEENDQDVTPLLNPVENLAQWKAVKAARPVRVKRVMKENVEADMDDIAKPLLKEIIINTSLSNWLTSSNSFHGNGSLKRSPIVDITNMENRLKD